MAQVDIIIPTHNRADLIAETLDSVAAQTFGDWACWVIDDGSTDDTERVVTPFVERDARFHYHRQENSGRSSAWKRGLTLTDSEYVGLLDSDDVWLPTYLETLAALLAAHPRAALAAAPFSNWDGSQVLSTQDFREDMRSDPLRAIIQGNYIIPSQCLYRRSALNSVKEFRFWPSDDVDLLLQILPGRGAVFAREPLVLYRRHGGNTWGDAISYEKLRLQAVLFIRILKKFVVRPDIGLRYRLLALGNLQRKYEHLLELDMDEGSVPRGLPMRLWRLLRIVPSPLLRSPGLARRYLRHRV